MKMKDFIVEFEKRHVKAKNHGCELSVSILAFLLLNQAQLNSDKKELIKATIVKLEYEEMKTKLLKVFGGAEKENPMDSLSVKIEENTFYGRNYQHQNTRTLRSNMNNRGNSRTRYQYRGYPRRGGAGGSRNSYKDKKQGRCNICESVFHYAKECPERVYYQEEEDEEGYDEDTFDIVLYQSNLVTPMDYEHGVLTQVMT